MSIPSTCRLNVSTKRRYIDIYCGDKPVSRRCRLLSIGRSSLHYESKGESAETLALMQRITLACRRSGYWYTGSEV